MSLKQIRRVCRIVSSKTIEEGLTVEARISNVPPKKTRAREEHKIFSKIHEKLLIKKFPYGKIIIKKSPISIRRHYYDIHK